MVNNKLNPFDPLMQYTVNLQFTMPINELDTQVRASLETRRCQNSRLGLYNFSRVTLNKYLNYLSCDNMGCLHGDPRLQLQPKAT